MYPYLLLAAFLQAPSEPGVPLIETCSDAERVIARLHPRESVRIRSSIAGESQTCYAVTALVEGKAVNGYVLGDALPGVAEFERQRKAGTPLEEAPPQDPAAAALDGKPRELFEDFSAVDLNGRSMSLKQMTGKAVVVCFWSPGSKSSQGELSQISGLFDEFHQKGLDAVAISVDPSPVRMLEALDDFSTSFPNVPDRAGVARKHNISNGAVPQTFVLNQNHQVVATGLHGNELQSAVLRLMGEK